MIPAPCRARMPSHGQLVAWWRMMAVVFTVTAAWAGEAGWRAGIGRENITPPPGLWMTGYAFRDLPADGVAQDLWVKALALADSAGHRGILFTLDLCDITREISDRVAASLMTRYALPRSAIITNVSHT